MDPNENPLQGMKPLWVNLLLSDLAGFSFFKIVIRVTWIFFEKLYNLQIVHFYHF